MLTNRCEYQGSSDMTHYIYVPCHHWCGLLKNPYSLLTMSVEYISTFANHSLVMVSSPYESKILDWDENPRPKIINKIKANLLTKQYEISLLTPRPFIALRIISNFTYKIKARVNIYYILYNLRSYKKDKHLQRNIATKHSTLNQNENIHSHNINTFQI